MQAVLTTSRLLNRHVGERTGCVQRDHRRLFGLLNCDVTVNLLLTLEELLGPDQGALWIFDALGADIGQQVSWVDHSH